MPLVFIFICLLVSFPIQSSDLASLNQLISQLGGAHPIRTQTFEQLQRLLDSRETNAQTRAALAQAQPADLEARRRVENLLARARVDWISILVTLRNVAENSPLMAHTARDGLALQKALLESPVLLELRSYYEKAEEDFTNQIDEVPKIDPRWEVADNFFQAKKQLLRRAFVDLFPQIFRASELVPDPKTIKAVECPAREQCLPIVETVAAREGNFYYVLIGLEDLQVSPVERRGKQFDPISVQVPSEQYLSAAQVATLGTIRENIPVLKFSFLTFRLSTRFNSNETLTFANAPPRWRSAFLRQARDSLRLLFPNEANHIDEAQAFLSLQERARDTPDTGSRFARWPNF